MTYPANNLPVLRCWRCDQPADVEWCDIQTLSDPAPMCIAGRITCLTAGCVDEDGTNATSDAAMARFYAA